MRVRWVSVMVAIVVGAGPGCGRRPVSSVDGGDASRPPDGPADAPAPKPDRSRADQPPPPPGWAVSLGGEWIDRIVVDPKGRIYLATEAGRPKVIALNAAGKQRWTLATTGGSFDLLDIAVGSSGDPCLAGYTGSQTVGLGKQRIPADRLLVAGLRSSGSVRWVFHHDRKGSTYQRFAKGVAVNTAGSCFATGSFVGKLVLGKTTLSSLTNPDLFLAAFSAAGNSQWARQAGGLMIDEGRSAAALPGGGVAIAGSFWNTAEFGSISITAAGNAPDAFVARYDAQGQVKWAIPLGWMNHDDSLRLEADGSGRLYLLGSFDQQTTIGKATLTDMDRDGLRVRFLARLSSAGKVSWAQVVDGSSLDRIAVDRKGNIYLSMNPATSGRAYIGSTVVRPAASSSKIWSLLAKLNSNGKLLWTRQISATSGVAIYDVAVGDGDRCHVAGGWKGTIKLDRTTLKSKSDSTEAFVWKLE